ncbi:hypothetical protein D3C87_624210 [compost metagenome]
MKPENLIGKLVEITYKESDYKGHWGFIRDWDGEVFHISGGSISSDFGEITPIFNREDFRIPRSIQGYISAGYLKIGVNIGEDGREIRNKTK